MLQLVPAALFLLAGSASPAQDDAPAALDARGLENLVAFARLLGYVRHFHPSDQAAAVDWDAAAWAGVSAVESAASDGALVGRLEEFFAPIAPTVQVFLTTATRPPLPATLAQTAGEDPQLVRWHNVGFGQPDGRLYSRKRDQRSLVDGRAPAGWTLPEEVYEAELVPGVACRIPTVLWSGAFGTLPFGTVTRDWGALPAGFLPTGFDRTTRLAGVVLAWNVFQHFYPYFDVTEVDWPAELARALAAAATDRDDLAFLDTLRRMVAALDDGHGSVSHERIRHLAVPQVCWGWIEEELVVFAPAADGALTPGDVVAEIDGVPAPEAFRSAAELLSASTAQHLRFKTLFVMGRGEPGTSVTLTVRKGDSATRTVAVARGESVPVEPRPEEIEELEEGIWYIDLGRIDAADFDDDLVDELASAKGIVFDLRGYPKI